MKVAKARKSTHGKGKGSKAIRSAGKKIASVSSVAREEPDKEWEIDVSEKLVCVLDS